jgi:predicted methyltransferase
MISKWRLSVGVVMSMLVMVAASALVRAATESETLLDTMLVADHRSDKNKARDLYRHPKETLLFFGFRADQTVVEMTPGAGWYTEILAPVLRGRGIYYAAVNRVGDKTPEALRDVDRLYRSKLADDPNRYDQVRLSVSTPPDSFSFAPARSADLVLTFRNVHNWARAGTVDAIFKAFFETLKPGGTLGVVEHRAREGTSAEQMIKTGYMTEAFVIEAATKAGFVLVAKSEINANPRDTKDYPDGVWTLPPTLKLGDQDRERYLAIGESDRMTLKFTKPW